MGSTSVHLNENELFKITIPSRTQAYLAVVKPIIMGVSGDASNLIIQSQSGYVCKPNNPQSLSEAINNLIRLSPEQLKEKGQNARNYYFENLSLSKGVLKFINIFKKVARND